MASRKLNSVVRQIRTTEVLLYELLHAEEPPERYWDSRRTENALEQELGRLRRKAWRMYREDEERPTPRRGRGTQEGVD